MKKKNLVRPVAENTHHASPSRHCSDHIVQTPLLELPLRHLHRDRELRGRRLYRGWRQAVEQRPERGGRGEVGEVGQQCLKSLRTVINGQYVLQVE